MHGLVLLRKDILHRIQGNNPLFQKSQQLIQYKKVTFLGYYHLPGKIQAVQNITALLRLLFFRKFVITAVLFLKPEDLDIHLIQLLQEIHRPAFLPLQELDDDHAFPLGSRTQALAQRQGGFPLCSAAVYLC